MTKSFFFVAWSLSAVLLIAQDSVPFRTSGNPDVRAELKPRTQAIYDAAKNWEFLLTRENPLGIEGAQGLELSGALIDGEFKRILVSVWTSRGKYAAEYYLDQDTLLHAYETFEYFEDKAPTQSWRNFKRVAAWERRTYFKDNSIGYGEARGVGAPEPGADPIRLITNARQLASLLEVRHPEDSRPKTPRNLEE